MSRRHTTADRPLVARQVSTGKRIEPWTVCACGHGALAHANPEGCFEPGCDCTERYVVVPPKP